MENKIKYEKSKGNEKNKAWDIFKKIALYTSIPLTLLTTSINSNAQEKKSLNYIYSNDKTTTVAGGGILIKKYKNNFELTPNSEINLDSLFYAEQEDINYNVLDSRKGLESIDDYLEEQELDKKDMALKNHIQGLLEYVKKNPSDSSTIKSLNKAVKDNLISAKGDSLYKNNEWNIKDGTYILIARSNETKNLKSQSIPTLIELNTHKNNSPVVERKNFGATLYGYNENNKDKQGKTFLEHDLTKKDLKEEKEKQEKEQKGKQHLGFIIKGDYGEKFYEIGAGLRFGPIAGLINYAKADDEKIQEKTIGPSPNNVFGYMRNDHKNFKGLGVSGEIYFPFFFDTQIFGGAGKTWWEFYNTAVQNVIKNKEVIKPHSYSESGKETSKEFYGGIIIPVDDNLWTRIKGGKDSKKGVYTGIGLYYNLKNTN